MTGMGDGPGDVPDTAVEPARREPVQRSFALLSTMLDFDGKSFGVRELAEAAEIPVTSVHRALGAMANAGMVRRHADGTYDIGFEFFRLASRAAALMPVRRAAQPVLQDLVARCGESAMLALYDPRRHMMMMKTYVSSGQPLQYQMELDVWSPIYKGATGLAILAGLTEADLDAALRQHGTTALLDPPLTDRVELDAELALTRQRGYAFSIGAGIPGAVAVAASFRGSAGELLGDLVVTFPDSRFDPGREEPLAALVCAAAADLTYRLGGSQVRVTAAS
jgi:IclR family transcriptional regulator, acetate operon repressor